MGAGLLGSLVVLALIDSTSFGTLLIPIWLMLAPGRLRPSRLLVFLATIAVFYLLLGSVLTLGAGLLVEHLGPVLELTAVSMGQLVLGVGLLVGSFAIGRKKAGEGEGEPGRILRWRERAMGGQSSPGALAALALTAAALEAATMLPYLAAIGLLSTSSLAWPVRLAVLAGYCVVMILPALLLLAGRLIAARAVRPLLEKVNAWMIKNAREGTAWIVAIIGFLIAQDAAQSLGLFQALGVRID